MSYNLYKFIKYASGDDYNTVYYYLGGYDFDQDNELVLSIIVNMIVDRIKCEQDGVKWSYESLENYEYYNKILIDNPDLSDNAQLKIEKRKALEDQSRQNGVIYIPKSEKFLEILKELYLSNKLGIDSRSSVEVMSNKSIIAEQFNELKWYHWLGIIFVIAHAIISISAK